MFHAQNCVLSELSKFSVRKTYCVNEVLFIQGPYDKMSRTGGKNSRTFQGLFKARANHVVSK